MIKAKSKTVVCKICGFSFDAPLTMKEFEGCYTETYCAQMDLEKYMKMVVENERRNNAMGDTPRG